MNILGSNSLVCFDHRTTGNRGAWTNKCTSGDPATLLNHDWSSNQVKTHFGKVVRACAKEDSL